MFYQGVAEGMDTIRSTYMQLQLLVLHILRSGETIVCGHYNIIHFQLAAEGPVHRLACEWYYYGTLLFDKNKELWTKLGPAVTAKIGYEAKSRSEFFQK